MDALSCTAATATTASTVTVTLELTGSVVLAEVHLPADRSHTHTPIHTPTSTLRRAGTDAGADRGMDKDNSRALQAQVRSQTRTLGPDCDRHTEELPLPLFAPLDVPEADVDLGLPRSPSQASEPWGEDEAEQLLVSYRARAAKVNQGLDEEATGKAKVKAKSGLESSSCSCDLWGLFVDGLGSAYDGTVSLFGGLCAPQPTAAQLASERLRVRLEVCNLEERWVAADGNCFYSSASDQLFSTPKHFHEIRETMVKQLQRESEHYQHFVDSGEAWEAYVERHSQYGTWADHVTMTALADAYGVSLVIISSCRGDDFLLTVTPRKRKSQRALWFSHLEDVHFNSLYKKGECPVNYTLC